MMGTVKLFKVRHVTRADLPQVDQSLHVFCLTHGILRGVDTQDGRLERVVPEDVNESVIVCHCVTTSEIEVQRSGREPRHHPG